MNLNLSSRLGRGRVVGSAPPPATSSLYLRTDGTSLYLRPSSTFKYLRPALNELGTMTLNGQPLVFNGNNLTYNG